MSNKKWIDVVLQHAENELKIMNLNKIEVGSTIIKLIRELHEISGNHPQVMKSVIHSIADLIDEKPISPITEDDFKLEIHCEGNRNVDVWRCTRCTHIYKLDGRYYDDRAIVYKTSYESTDKQYIYQGGMSSKQEISLPYVVREKVIIISNE